MFETQNKQWLKPTQVFFKISKIYSLAPYHVNTATGTIKFQKYFQLYSYLFILINFGLLIYTAVTKPDNGGFREWVNKSENIQLAAVTFILHLLGVTSSRERVNCFEQLVAVTTNVEPKLVRQIIWLELGFIGFCISVFYGAYTFGSYLLLMMNYEHTLALTISNYLRLLFWTCVILNEFQYVNFVLLLAKCFGNLAKSLLQIKEQQVSLRKGNSIRNSSLSLVENQLSLQLSRISNRFNNLFELRQQINQIFAYQLLITFMNLFVEVSFSTYFFIIHLLEQHTESASVKLYGCYLLAWGLYNWLRLLIVTGSSQKLHNEIQNSPIAVHKLMTEVTDYYHKDQLESMSYQLFALKSKMSACGLFDVDFSLTSSIAGAIVTYMIILVQFQISSISEQATTTNNCSSIQT